MNDQVRLEALISGERSAVMRALLDGLEQALRRHGVHVQRAAGGDVTAAGAVVGRIAAWQEDQRVALEMHCAPWLEGNVRIEAELRAAQETGGTRVTLELRGLDGVFNGEDVAAWLGAEVIAGVTLALTPARTGDWVTDRNARRPTGAQSREVYADPLYHYPNFAVILDELALEADDHLLEVGCGGGAMLARALGSGCSAIGLDHSIEMAQLARQVNADAIAIARLGVVQGSAGALPFADGSFTCAAMTGVLGFLDDPVGALAEVRRVLRPGGHFVALGSDPDMKGTPAAPEPYASRLRFYTSDELADVARSAGFEDVRVDLRDLERHARDAGVPEEHIPLFAGERTSFLVARRR